MPRRPSYQREIRRGQIQDWPQGADPPTEVAARLTYTGSPLHKTYPSPAGPPAYRSDKAKCANYPSDQWPRLLDALRAGVRAGYVSSFRGGFPDRVWVWVNDVLHEARLTNAGVGDYHGFPLEDSRYYPEPVERLEAAPRVTIPQI